MPSQAEMFEPTLAALQAYDGKLWLRILGQTHWQYNELPFWVLLESREQIADAIPVLQKHLAPLQNGPEADVTVSFITFEDGRDCSHGLIEGEELFGPHVMELIYDEPECGERKPRIFDAVYPDDPWVIKTS